MIFADASNNSSIMIQNTGGGNPVRDYCKGCGGSEIPGMFCKPEYNLFTNEVVLICDYGSTCPKNTLNASAPIGYSGELLEDSICYDIRDNFLIESNIGQKYITNINLLTQFAQNTSSINASNALQHINFAIATKNVLLVLKNGSNSDIPISTQYKNDAIALINYYKTLTSENIFINLLNDIENDFNLYVNKTREEILNETN